MSTLFPILLCFCPTTFNYLPLFCWVKILFFTHIKHPCVLQSIYADISRASLVAQTVKRVPTMRESRVWSLGREDPLEKEMATHFSIHAQKIPWTEEPGGRQPMGSQRVGHDALMIILTIFGMLVNSLGLKNKEIYVPLRRGQVSTVLWLRNYHSWHMSYLFVNYLGNMYFLVSHKISHKILYIHYIPWFQISRKKTDSSINNFWTTGYPSENKSKFPSSQIHQTE